MSKKTIYKCDICDEVTELCRLNKFKRTTYDWRHWSNDGWKTKEVDICDDCLEIIKDTRKQKKVGDKK